MGYLGRKATALLQVASPTTTVAERWWNNPDKHHVGPRGRSSPVDEDPHWGFPDPTVEAPPVQTRFGAFIAPAGTRSLRDKCWRSTDPGKSQDERIEDRQPPFDC